MITYVRVTVWDFIRLILTSAVRNAGSILDTDVLLRRISGVDREPCHPHHVKDLKNGSLQSMNGFVGMSFRHGSQNAAYSNNH